MTTVFVEIANLDFFYKRLGLFCENMLSEKEFLEQIKSNLEIHLKKYGVQKVSIKVGHPDMFFNLYVIKMKNTRNDWQEEAIMEEIDLVCLDFVKRQNLQKICAE